MTSIRVALKGRVPEAQIDAFAAAWDWSPLPNLGKMAEEGFEKAWISTRSAARIWYRDDAVLGHQCLLIEGQEAQDVASWVSLLLPVLTREDLRQAVSEARDPAAWVLLMKLAAAVAQSEYDPEIFLILGAGFVYFEPQVRRAAVLAAAYLSWRELEPPLERLAGEDPDGDVRAEAVVALDRLRARDRHCAAQDTVKRGLL